MSSLKGYIPGLARLLETSSAALYERQRALVRAGLLETANGRGPGSGVRTTWGSVALLTLSVLATESLGQSADRVRALAASKPIDNRLCPYTRRPNLGLALSFLLSASSTAAGVIELTISRTATRAVLRYWDDDGTAKATEFGERAAREPAIRVDATLAGTRLAEIATDVQAIILSDFEGDKGGAP